MKKSNKNLYNCKQCGSAIVTIDKDQGTTPMTIRCKDCKTGVMYSFMYNVPSIIVPSHQWYRPEDLSVLSLAEKTHVKNGGLLLKKIQIR